MKKWDSLPSKMKNDNVLLYYNNLKKRYFSLLLKKMFDVSFSFVLLIVLMPLFFIIAIIIKIDSKGPVKKKKKRVTRYLKEFTIYKFRSMTHFQESNASEITTAHDTRVTRFGKFLRKTKFDEIPQLVNILLGDMSFVGTRPEVPKYVQFYSDEMFATLLLPAGVTSLASIKYKDESSLLESASDVELVYKNVILPKKMIYNLQSIRNYTFLSDIYIILLTIVAVVFFRKNGD